MAGPYVTDYDGPPLPGPDTVAVAARQRDAAERRQREQARLPVPPPRWEQRDDPRVRIEGGVLVDAVIGALARALADHRLSAAQRDRLNAIVGGAS